MKARRGRYWLLFLAHFLLANGISVWAQVQIARAQLSLLQPGLLVAPVALSLVFIRARRWHAFCLVGLLALYVTQLFGQALGGV